MAGTITRSTVTHRSRGVVKALVDFTCDASGDASITSIGSLFGRLKAVAIPVGGATFAYGSAVITVTDGVSGAALLTIDTDPFAQEAGSGQFTSTTTGDDTGGAAEDLFTTGAAHGLAIGDWIIPLTKTGGTLPTLGTAYIVRTASFAATTFTLATAAIGGAAIDLGSDITAMTWIKVGGQAAVKYFRPSADLADINGAAVAASANNPTTDRDILFNGKISVTVAQGGNLGHGYLHLIVDETGLGNTELPVGG